MEDEGKKGDLGYRNDKSDYRDMIAGLEGITGKKALDSAALKVKKLTGCPAAPARRVRVVRLLKNESGSALALTRAIL
jgi:hypothetical protein